MLKNFSKTAGIIGAIALVAGCSSSSSSGVRGTSGFATVPTTQEALQFGALAVEDFDRIAGDFGSPGIPGTAFDQIPDAGAATYTGPAEVAIFTRETTVNGGTTTITETGLVSMIGTSRVTYNFANDTFSGSITDMFAVDLDNFDTDLVSGSVDIANGGQADPTARPTFLEADATGTLSTFGETYTIDVPLEGLLRGTNPNAPDDIPVQAISLGGEGTVAGSTLLSSIETVGDKDAANRGAFVNR